MKILLDEMYTGLKEHLEVLGWKLETVYDIGLEGKRDKEIVLYARENDLLLVTQDQKLAELAELLSVKYVLISNAVIAKAIYREINKKYLRKNTLAHISQENVSLET